MWYGFPSMCNGANLAFRKGTFFEVGGYANNLHIPSGDDEFLMRKIFKMYPDGIHFVKDSDAVVSTSAAWQPERICAPTGPLGGQMETRCVLLERRPGYFYFLLSVIGAYVAYGHRDGMDRHWLRDSLFTLKFIAEGFFLKKIALFVKVPWKWRAFIFLQIFYPIYAVWIGLISSFSTFEWKGRKLKSVAFSMAKK